MLRVSGGDVELPSAESSGDDDDTVDDGTAAFLETYKKTCAERLQRAREMVGHIKAVWGG